MTYNKNPRVKVVNKNKEGVILKSLNGGITTPRISWEEFYENFKEVDKEQFIYEMCLSKEFDEEVTRITPRINWVTENMARILILVHGELTVEKLSSLSFIVEEYKEKFGKDVFQLKEDVELIRQVLFT